MSRCWVFTIVVVALSGCGEGGGTLGTVGGDVEVAQIGEVSSIVLHTEGEEDHAGLLRQHSFFLDGKLRTFISYRPRPQATHRPLLILMHGGTGSARGMFDFIDLRSHADAYGVDIIYPQGTSDPWGGIGHYWNDGRGISSVDDQRYLDVIIDTVVRWELTDPSQVFMSGISNGASMSFAYACAHPGKLAGIVPVINSIPELIAESCREQLLSIDAGGATAMLHIGGTDDPAVPWEGGPIAPVEGGNDRGTVIPFWQASRLFAEHNGCTDETTEHVYPDVDPDDGGSLVRHDFAGCQSGNIVSLIEMVGGGHSWPDPDVTWPVWMQGLIGPVVRDYSIKDLLFEMVSGELVDFPQVDEPPIDEPAVEDPAEEQAWTPPFGDPTGGIHPRRAALWMEAMAGNSAMPYSGALARPVVVVLGGQPKHPDAYNYKLIHGNINLPMSEAQIRAFVRRAILEEGYAGVALDHEGWTLTPPYRHILRWMYEEAEAAGGKFINAPKITLDHHVNAWGVSAAEVIREFQRYTHATMGWIYNFEAAQYRSMIQTWRHYGYTRLIWAVGDFGRESTNLDPQYLTTEQVQRTIVELARGTPAIPYCLFSPLPNSSHAPTARASRIVLETMATFLPGGEPTSGSGDTGSDDTGSGVVGTGDDAGAELDAMIRQAFFDLMGCYPDQAQLDAIKEGLAQGMSVEEISALVRQYGYCP